MYDWLHMSRQLVSCNDALKDHQQIGDHLIQSLLDMAQQEVGDWVGCELIAVAKTFTVSNNK